MRFKPLKPHKYRNNSNKMNSNIADQHETIKSLINIVEVIGQFVPLKRRTGNFIANCPFHNEKTPSFNVSPAKGIYKCFGCGASGDAIKFLMDHERLEYLDAMRWLADYYHVPLDENAPRVYVRPTPRPTAAIKANVPPASYIPRSIFNQSLKKYNENSLVSFLHTLFEPIIVEMLIDKYYIGTSRYYSGGTIFWQVDEQGNIRTGKIMPYNPITGKRERLAIPASNWVHSVLKLDGFNLQQCFFGQHLLCDDMSMPVAVVESEKSAVIASVFIPSFVWIATGGKGYEKLNKNGDLMAVPDLLREKFRILAGRKVVLFPDLGAVEDWQHLAAELADITDVSVNDMLIEAAAEHQLPDKSDLCDYLISPGARRELIEAYKTALTDQIPETKAEGIKIFEYYRDRGLMIKDMKIAHAELIAEGKVS